MIEISYAFKTAKNSDPINSSWNEAQEWCNFVLFKPTWLPKGLIETSNKIRPESPSETSSYRAEFNEGNRSLSIKQFLYDWAPPAYDHPCLWRNAKISTPENTPLSRAYLIGNNYLWFGLDYKIAASDVPISYFEHTRNKAFHCYPHYAASLDIKPNLPGYWFKHAAIKDYKLDSIFLFGKNTQDIQEAEYYFESLIEPGTYIRFLVTSKNSDYAIQYPPELGDQACHIARHSLKSGETLYHAWSKTNENGCHSLVFQTKNETVNCIIKPAPWTTIRWAKDLCTNLEKLYDYIFIF